MTALPPTILIVDDAPENLALIAGILKASYRTRVVPTGTKALELIAKGPPPT